MKIAIIGTHSTGKTTLLNELKNHIDLPIITEVARDFPRCTINDPVTEMGRQISIFNAQLLAEMNHFNGFLSDRSTIDNAAYMILSLQKYSNDIPLNDYINVLVSIEFAIDHGEEYDYLFYIPIEFPLVNDGFRDMDEIERVNIDFIINKIKPKIIKITGTVEERVNKVLEYIL